jgi:hypothetical protein
MACTDGTKLYTNIKELPVTTDITNGDFLIVETPTGTNILDYTDLLITLDNTTFAGVISGNTTDILSLQTQFNTLSSTLTTQVQEVSAQTDRSYTYAVFSLTTYSSAGADVNSGERNIPILNGSNIASITLNTTTSFNIGTSAVTINFLTNFASNNYCVTFGAQDTINRPLVSAKSFGTNSLSLEVTNSSNAFCTANRVCVQIIN